MSIQEINLYLPELRPKKQTFTAEFCALTSVALLAVLVAISIYSTRSQVRLEQSVVNLENQKVAVNARVEKIKLRTVGTSRVNLDKRISELRKGIADREVMEKIIEWQNLGNEEGFAHVLVSLSKHSKQEFSLDRIRLSAGGKTLELAGYTRKAQSIPRYLQKLQAEENLQHTRFGLLSMGGDNKIKAFSLGFESVYDLAGDNR